MAFIQPVKVISDSSGWLKNRQTVWIVSSVFPEANRSLNNEVQQTATISIIVYVAALPLVPLEVPWTGQTTAKQSSPEQRDRHETFNKGNACLPIQQGEPAWPGG